MNRLGLSGRPVLLDPPREQPDASTQYHYFFTVVFTSRMGQMQFANADIALPEPISDSGPLRGVAEVLAKQFQAPGCAILNFVLLRGPQAS